VVTATGQVSHCCCVQKFLLVFTSPVCSEVIASLQTATTDINHQTSQFLVKNIMVLTALRASHWVEPACLASPGCADMP
jgi:type III secretory pathway component EscS